MPGGQRRRKPVAKRAPAKGRGAEESGPGAEKFDRSKWLHEQVVEGVEKLATEGGWRSFLDFKSKFRSRSFNNTLLILMQDPTATMVAGYKDWTKKFKRQVLSQKEGGQPLYYFAPHTYWATEVNEQTGKEEPVKKRGFHATHGYDIKSTVGPPVPERPKYTELHGDAPEPMWDALLAWMAHEGYVVDLEDLPPGLHGDTAPNGQVRINQHLSRLAQVATLNHEGPGHVGNGHIEDIENYHGHRGRFEVEAESTAYIVGTALGLDLGTTSFEYIAGWAKANSELVSEVGDKVCKTADRVLNFLVRELGMDVEERFGTEREQVGDIIEIELPELPS